MKLSNLSIPRDAQRLPDKIKKAKTSFELKRAAATTYTQLVALGYEEGMEFPESWAQHVLAQRNNSF